MRKVVAATMLLGVLLALSAPATADAHKLSKTGALNRTLSAAGARCSQAPHCIDFDARGCKRFSRHKIGCLAETEYRTSDPSRSVYCVASLLTAIARNGNRVFVVKVFDDDCFSGAPGLL